MKNNEKGQSVRLRRRRGGLQRSSLMETPRGTLADRAAVAGRGGPLPTSRRGNSARGVQVAKMRKLVPKLLLTGKVIGRYNAVNLWRSIQGQKPLPQ